ncbi:hypothetical protein GYB59_02100 [bacterium]|nr:hypothetical protein [bacterium]
MSNQLNLGDDLLFVDGLQDFTLTRLDGSTETELPGLRRSIRHIEAARSNGELQSGDVRIHLKSSPVSSVPMMGEVLTDADGNDWTILGVEEATLNSRFACVCRRLDVLRSTITIQEATYSKGDYGEQVATWANVAGFVDVKGSATRVQGSRNVDQGRLSMSDQYEVRMLGKFEFKPHHRIVTSEGKKLRVVGYGDAGTLGAVQRIDCEVDTSEN